MSWGFDPAAFIKTIRARGAPPKTLFSKILRRLHTRFDLARPIDNVRPESLRDVVNYTVSALAETSTTFSRTKIIAEVCALVEGREAVKDMNSLITSLDKAGTLVEYKPGQNQGNKYYNAKSHRV